MKNRHGLLSLIKITNLIAALGVGLNAEAGLFGFGGDSWKEEVLLHDGNKIVVARSQTYGGRHEIGQPPPIKEHTIFYLLAVHVLNGTPHIVAKPNHCISYNKWGRPNPPYVFFKYDGQAWQRVPLEAFPGEFRTINVALDIMGREVENLVSLRLVSSEKIKALNAHTTILEHKTILREPVKRGSVGSAVNCEELVLYKGHWILPNDPIARKLIDQRRQP